MKTTNKFITGLAYLLFNVLVLGALNTKAQQVVAFASKDTICEGDIDTLIATGADYYWWDGNYQYSSIMIVHPNTTKTYTVWGMTDSTQTTTTITIVVFQNPAKPILTVSGNCSPVTLGVVNPNPQYSYLWNNGNTTPSITTIISETDTVIVTNQNGCKNSNWINVFANPTPVANAGLDQQVCEGVNVTLHGTSNLPNSSFHWIGGPYSQIFYPNQQIGTCDYYLEVMVAGCVSSLDTVRVTKNPKPITPVLSTIQPYQIGCDSVNIVTANQTISQYYQWSNGELNPNTTVFVLGTYEVITTNVHGCTASNSITVDVHDVPIANAGQDQQVCKGENVTLYGTSSVNSGYIYYNWVGWTNSQSFSFPATVTRDYYFKVTVDGCTSLPDTVKVTVHNPLVTTSGAVSICSGESAVLVVSGTNNYSWSPIGTLNVSTGDTVIATPVVTTNYTVVGTDTNGCSANSSLKVTVNSSPTFTVNGSDYGCGYGVSCHGLHDGQASVSWNYSGYSYLWSTGENSINIENLTAGNYLVTVTNFNNCSAVDSVALVNPPEVEIYFITEFWETNSVKLIIDFTEDLCWDGKTPRVLLGSQYYYATNMGTSDGKIELVLPISVYSNANYLQVLWGDCLSDPFLLHNYSGILLITFEQVELMKSKGIKVYDLLGQQVDYHRLSSFKIYLTEDRELFMIVE
jgi:hypothetical protein